MEAADRQWMNVFGKFEDPAFVHTMRLPAPSHALQFHLPRFGLAFVEEADGRLSSVVHRDFVLRQVQQRGSGQMPRFYQYLVLESATAGTTQRRVLIPAGRVTLAGSSGVGVVTIEVPGDASASVQYSAIDEHPRLKTLAPDTVESRLQLAAVFAASGGHLPWMDIGMTGGEAALQLLRGCVPSRPFSARASEYLTSIASRFSFRTPVLTLLCGLLVEKAHRLGFLFGSSDAATVACTDAMDEYREAQSNAWAARAYPHRQRLTHAEERDIFGASTATEAHHARAYSARESVESRAAVEEDEVASPVAANLVETVHCAIALLCAPREPAAPSSGRLGRFLSACSTTGQALSPSFPLSPPESNTMSEQMTRELRDSWEVFHRHNARESLALSVGELKARAEDLLATVREGRTLLDNHLKQTVAAARGSVQDRLLASVGRVARLTLPDVMLSVLDENALVQLAPRLSVQRRRQWKQQSIRLLELCVLEDKLARIARSGGVDTKLLEEIQTTQRAWDPQEHPYWLVFEVEGQLQIRQEQYVIAKHLMDNPGSICQLNMGRGKTRVILPMLFLYYSYEARRESSVVKLPRAHFLSALLSETREFMWRVLTSGVLTLPFVELPFNRSCSLGVRELRLMRHTLLEAKRNGAVVMVAPEHRLSLELKRVELHSFGACETTAAVVTLLDDVLNRDLYVDIFDESDALLHHTYHLVYAVGASASLDGGSNRWLAAEGLLRVLISARSSRVQATLAQFPELWSARPEYSERRGSRSGGGIYNGLQLSVAAVAAETARAALRVALVEDLMDHAPFDLEWLRVYGAASAVRGPLIRLLTDVTVDADEALAELPPAILKARHQVLALRGLLAFGVLENCLQKRYRVNYGHPPPGSRPKAIAIPFQAADLPSDRSEFSHPDVGIVLTLLAFYHSGLTDVQIRRAFEVLLALDASESNRYYGEWFGSIASSLDDRHERELLSDLLHISLDNPHQFANVCGAYRFAVGVANFYLNFCVFPSDTRQFPSRISRSAWDLVRGPSNVGFSGTNDTHRLLPLAVAQREPDEPSLRGTNGKMVQLLLEATRGYEILATAEPRAGDDACSSVRACWQSLLLLAVEKRCHALIDTGALLAGVANHEAAEFLVALPAFAAQGVTYYDTRPAVDGWAVLDSERKLACPHKTSSLRECDTFVIFDEARARGSDMKLRAQAVALLSLGPTITKDKLMQGAGRMRQLGRDRQTLWLTSTHDVHASVARQHGGESQPPSTIGVVEILNWVVDNTSRQCTFGVLEWAQSGIQHHAKEVDPARELEADDWTLDGQYAGAQTEQLIGEIVQTKLAQRAGSLLASEATPPENVAALGRIRAHGERFGRHDVVCVTSFGEECERELQIEEQQQKQREYVRHRVQACAERAWSWRSLLDGSSVREITGARVVSLETAARAWFEPRACRAIAWAASRVYGTANFWRTVTPSPASTQFVWNACLRQLHALVVFADGSVLALSEFEADAVLAMLLTKRASSSARERVHRGRFAFVQLPFVAGVLARLPTGASLDVAASQVPLAVGWDRGRAAVAPAMTVPFLAVVTCCLLNGDTDLFGDRHAQAAGAALRTLLAPLRHREETLQAWVTLRGFAVRWKRSGLHAVAKRLDLEDDGGGGEDPQQQQQQ